MAGGGVASADNVSLFNYALSGGLAVACNCGVNCFYLISGFFISPNETLERSKKRILKVWVPTLVYSVIIPLLLLVTGKIQLSGKQIALLFMPVMGNQYWFATCFIAMSALLPYISKALNSSDDKMLIALMIIMIFFDSIQPLGVNAFSNIGYGIMHAATMYVIGYAIRRFAWRINSIIAASIYAACVVAIGIITIVSVKLTGDRNRTIADYNSIIVIIQSVAFFMFFLNMKIKRIRFSKIAPYVFGVYLLNDNSYARDFLWHDIFHTERYYNSNMMPIHFLGVVLVFVVCALTIEYIRITAWKVLREKVRING